MEIDIFIDLVRGTSAIATAGSECMSAPSRCPLGCKISVTRCSDSRECLLVMMTELSLGTIYVCISNKYTKILITHKFINYDRGYQLFKNINAHHSRLKLINSVVLKIRGKMCEPEIFLQKQTKMAAMTKQTKNRQWCKFVVSYL